MTAATATDTGLTAGFADPVLDSQKVFRAVLEAMARPGTIVALPVRASAPRTLDAATTAVLLALADYETPVWLDSAADQPATTDYLRFHCGCPIAADPRSAVFAVVAAPKDMPPLSAFNPGSDEYPDRSATVIVQVPSLTNGAPWTLSGPGIRDTACLSAGGFPPDFLRWVTENHELFPCGIDLIFTCGDALAAIPRSTRLGV